MITMSTKKVCEYLKSKFPDVSKYIRNGNIDKKAPKSIGVFTGSDTRSNGNLDIGGIECTAVRMIPINIMIRWTDNQQECDDVAIGMYNSLLLEKSNFMLDDVKIAFISMLDVCPVFIGRDERNICEVTIRANFYYYV